MTCSDVQRVLPEILDGGPDARLAPEFKTHVQSCPDCSDLVSDLKLITSEARQLAATEEPSPSVWLGIAAQLRAEGLVNDALIHEPESLKTSVDTSAAPRPILVPSAPRRRWSTWWLAPVAAGLVAAGSYVVSHKPAPQMAKQQAPATPGPSASPTSSEETPTVTVAPAPAPASQVAEKSAPPTPPRHVVAPAG